MEPCPAAYLSSATAMLSLNFFTIVALTAPLLALLAGLLPAVQVYLNLSTEHCYHNVVTLSTRDGPQVANCISISPNGTVVGLRNFTLIEQTRGMKAWDLERASAN